MTLNKLLFKCFISLYLGIIILNLVQDGMFSDGVIYATLSHNLSQGMGSWYEPYYSNTDYPKFFEHPPLMFILQSFFFTLLGSSFITERLYCFLFSVLLFYIIYRICKELQAGNTRSVIDGFFISCILLFSMPIFSWAIYNNMLELTMCVFSFLSLWMFLKAIRKNPIPYSFLSAALLFLAFLSKGPVSLFVLAAGSIHFLVYRKTEVLWMSFLQIFFFTFIFAGLYFALPDLQYNLKNYWEIQVKSTLNKSREIHDNTGIVFFWNLIQQLAIALILLLLYLFSHSKNKWNKPSRASIFFMGIALSASLPMLISPKFHPHYLFASLPFFALSIGNFLEVWLMKIFKSLSTYFYKISIFFNLVICILIIICLISYGKARRDVDELHDVHIMTQHLPPYANVYTTGDLTSNSALSNYLARYGGISLYSWGYENYSINLKGRTDVVGKEFKLIPLDTYKYDLWWNGSSVRKNE